MYELDLKPHAKECSLEELLAKAGPYGYVDPRILGVSLTPTEQVFAHKELRILEIDRVEDTKTVLLRSRDLGLVAPSWEDVFRFEIAEPNAQLEGRIVFLQNEVLIDASRFRNCFMVSGWSAVRGIYLTCCEPWACWLKGTRFVFVDPAGST